MTSSIAVGDRVAYQHQTEPYEVLELGEMRGYPAVRLPQGWRPAYMFKVVEKA